MYHPRVISMNIIMDNMVVKCQLHSNLDRGVLLISRSRVDSTFYFVKVSEDSSRSKLKKEKVREITTGMNNEKDGVREGEWKRGREREREDLY